MDIEKLVMTYQKDLHSKECENFIIEYKPFILSTASKKMKKYISSENDDAFSIALSAFLEAIEKYDPEKGNFLSFAKLVIERRIQNYTLRGDKQIHENLDDMQVVDTHMSVEDELILKEEIRFFEMKLQEFGISFEDLVKESPVHKDTREQAIQIGKQTSKEEDLVEHLYRTKRLPVTKMCQRFRITRKIVYGSKNFIISVVIVFHEKLSLIVKYL
jgi:RNA polymerase sigma factor